MSLPSGYKQLEYIQSSGSQYIDTGLKPTQDYSMTIKCQSTGTSSNTYAACDTNWQNTGFFIGVSVFEFGNASTMSAQNYGENPIVLTLDKTGGYKDGVKTWNNTSTATFQTVSNLTLFALNRNGTIREYLTGKIYYCTISNNGTLVRNFIPCKNPDGVIGMWDDVNSVFYGNAGTGSFAAGAEVKGSHKTLIDGTAYKITSGRDLVGGTGYGIKSGKTLIGGTAYDIPFSKGIPLNTITPGAILMLNESGNPVPFYIAKHDYESGLNGAGRTLVVRKDCYDNRQWHSSNVNAYASSAIDSWLNGTYKNLLDADIRGVIGTTKIKYTTGNGNNAVGTLERAIFLLSATELNRSESWFNVEGTALEIASSLQIAYMNGSAVAQWTRSPITNYANYAVCLLANGNAYYYFCTVACGSRPAFTLPGTLGLAQNPDGTYSPAA